MDKPEEKGVNFSILIPTWNNLPYLKLCLESISEHSILKHQVIVIINEGADGTKEWIQTQKNIESVYFNENVGICTALNAGVNIAITDYILYLNDDMFVLPGWDIKLKEEIAKIGQTKFFLSSTMIEPIDTGNACVIVKDYGNTIENFRKDELLKEFFSLKKQDWNGATWPPNVMHKSIWNAVGGMSIEFSPGMYSDPDLSMKLWQYGIRYFKGLGNSKVYHFGTKSTSRIKQSNGKEIFFKKWGITAGSFARYYLKRGTKFEGPLPEAQLPVLAKIKGNLKKMNF